RSPSPRPWRTRPSRRRLAETPGTSTRPVSPAPNRVVQNGPHAPDTVLSWSRATFARFTLDQTLESFVRCHVEAFEAFGGVPREALYDNLKSVVIERQGDLIRFHPHILELC